MKRLALFISTMMFVQSALATGACFRFLGAAPVNATEECVLPVSEIEKRLRTSVLNADYERFLVTQDQNPKLAFFHFMKSALQKIWSSEDESLVREVVEWSRRQRWTVDPAMGKVILQLEGRHEIHLRATMGRASWVEGISQWPGWEDVVVTASASPTETESEILAATQARRWTAVSSVFKPVAFFGTAKDFSAHLLTQQIPWVTGTCLKPKWEIAPLAGVDLRAVDKNACISAKLGSAVPANSETPPPELPQHSWPQTPKPSQKVSPVWVWLGVAAGVLAVGAGMKGKSIEITPGFR